MLKAFAEFLDALGGSPAPSGAVDEDLLSAAAMLVQVAFVDGAVAPAETAWLQDAVQARTGLPEGVVRDLIAEAERRARESGGGASLASSGRRLPPEERRRLVGLMWRMALADGRVHEFEDSLISRAAEILGLSPQDAEAIRAAEGAG